MQFKVANSAKYSYRLPLRHMQNQFTQPVLPYTRGIFIDSLIGNPHGKILHTIMPDDPELTWHYPLREFCPDKS